VPSWVFLSDFPSRGGFTPPLGVPIRQSPAHVLEGAPSFVRLRRKRWALTPERQPTSALLPASCYLLTVFRYPSHPPLHQSSCHLQKQNRRKLSLPPALQDPHSLSGTLLNFRCLRSFGSLHYLEFDRITLLQRPVTISGYRRVVYEHIGPIFPAYESVSLRIIKPLHCSLHFVSPLDGDSGGGKHRRRHEHELRGVYQTGNRSQANCVINISPMCIFIPL